MLLFRIAFISFFILIALHNVAAQNLTDTVFSISQVPQKYVTQVNHKIAKYRNRVASKTEKTLNKLSRWENKIHILLQKTNPEIAERLFGNSQLTFKALLQKIKEGEVVAENYAAPYDGYVDKLSTTIKYLQQQKSKADTKLIRSVKYVGEQMSHLQNQLGESSYIKQFIKERKKQLFAEAASYLGKSKYLSKINKESYYYVATIKNYKDLFSDATKTEATAKEVLGKIPAFQQFMQKNSQLASLFSLPGNSRNSAQSLAGLQTRASVQGMIQQRIASGGPNAMAQVQQNLAQAHSEMNKLKDKINKLGGGSSDMEIPDFKPNEQKTKTLWQRLEYGFNVQFSKSNSLVPSTSDIALSLGYKLNNKSTAGIGISYKLGLGNLQHISFSSQGIGWRSFWDYKIPSPFGGSGGGLYVNGGYETNYNAGFKNIEQLKNYSGWQRSALIGISKKYKISKKLKGNMQLLYDFFARDHVPVSQPILFRVGYNF